MIEELARHGYRISAGSLYPLLHGLEKKGYLRSTGVRNSKSLRKVYRATPFGKMALSAVKSTIGELFREVVERRSENPNSWAVGYRAVSRRIKSRSERQCCR